MSHNSPEFEFTESTFPSNLFPDYFYEIIGRLGQGGLGTVYAVLLRNKRT